MRVTTLRGLRRRIGKTSVECVEVWELGSFGGEEPDAILRVRFNTGESCEMAFASLAVLLRSLRMWRGLYGSPLERATFEHPLSYMGIIGYANPYLKGGI